MNKSSDINNRYFVRVSSSSSIQHLSHQAYVDNRTLIKFSTIESEKSMTCNALETNERFQRRLSMHAYDTLNDLRYNGLLCDSTIKVSDGVEFPIHRAILSGKNLALKFNTRFFFKLFFVSKRLAITLKRCSLTE
jgi:hypothetical protein